MSKLNALVALNNNISAYFEVFRTFHDVSTGESICIIHIQNSNYATLPLSLASTNIVGGTVSLDVIQIPTVISGNFQLWFGGYLTTPIPYNSSAVLMKHILEVIFIFFSQYYFTIYFFRLCLLWVL